MKGVIFLLLIMPMIGFAEGLGMPAVTVTKNAGGGETYSLSLQILFAMTAFSLLPAILMLMTSFARVVIVLSILRQAVGMPQTPTNQILIGMALFLTLFIMTPVFNKVYTTSLAPYMENKISQKEALDKALIPMRGFMLKQTRKDDLELFKKMANVDMETKIKDLPFTVIMPAFVTSELKTAFQIGFILFIPFLIIDLVVASVLMAMGMMMLSPLIVSLPFKVMLFVLVDGWALVIGTLAASFGI